LVIVYFPSGGGKGFVVWLRRNRFDMEFFADGATAMGFSEAWQAQAALD
jgi:hypothetical protein